MRALWGLGGKRGPRVVGGWHLILYVPSGLSSCLEGRKGGKVGGRKKGREGRRKKGLRNTKYESFKFHDLDIEYMRKINT